MRCTISSSSEPPSEQHHKRVYRLWRHKPFGVWEAETEAHGKMIQLLPHLLLLPEGAVLGPVFLDATRPPVEERIWVLWAVPDDFAAVVLVHVKPCARNPGQVNTGDDKHNTGCTPVVSTPHTPSVETNRRFAAAGPGTAKRAHYSKTR